VIAVNGSNMVNGLYLPVAVALANAFKEAKIDAVFMPTEIRPEDLVLIVPNKEGF
jgi:hypothetical protein